MFYLFVEIKMENYSRISLSFFCHCLIFLANVIANYNGRLNLKFYFCCNCLIILLDTIFMPILLQILSSFYIPYVFLIFILKFS